MLDTLVLGLGLAVLFVCADLLVAGASSIALGMKVPPLVVGLTVVSFGTSLPEMLVTFTAGVQHDPDLAIANIIGSNIANVLLVLGVAAMIRPLPVKDSTVVSEIPFSVTAALLVGFLANAALFTTSQQLMISRLDGFILLFFFFLFMLYVYRASRVELQQEGGEGARLSAGKAWIYISIGVVGLYFGGQWVVEGAVRLARLMGVEDALIGATIVAVGTSLPELVASAVAARRNEADIAVGNVVGSNIFNLLWILGITAATAGLPFKAVNNMDLVIMVGSSSLVILAIATDRHNTITRVHGALFVLLYLGYVTYLLMR